MAPMIVLPVPRPEPRAKSQSTSPTRSAAVASTHITAQNGASRHPSTARNDAEVSKRTLLHLRRASGTNVRVVMRQHRGCSPSPITLDNMTDDEAGAETISSTSTSGLPRLRARSGLRFRSASATSVSASSDSTLTPHGSDEVDGTGSPSSDSISSRTTPPSYRRGNGTSKEKAAEHVGSDDTNENEASESSALENMSTGDVAVPAFGRPSSDAERDLGRLFEAVQGARRITVICGAGISVSPPANIPDFRSSQGLFRKLKEQHPNAGLSSGKDLFDARLFQSDATTDLFHGMIAELKRMADVAQPTSFHHLLKMLDEQGRLLRVYTQNIDGLEMRAGLSFGLGENGDGATKPVRAASAKRKRTTNTNSKDVRSIENMDRAAPTPSKPAPPVAKDSLAGRRSWVRSQSDSALLWSNSISNASAASTEQVVGPPPMFPRCIPLHGSLHTITCGICAFKLDISPDMGLDGPNTPPPNLGATVSKPSDALELLLQGQPIPCPRCEVADEVRTSNGMRSRGIGLMKVDVVLYGGQNNSAERVGECISRDILGLRDPNETPVPESFRETQARERREKNMAQQKKEEEVKVKAAAASTAKAESQVEVIGILETASSADSGRGSTPEKPFHKRKFTPSKSEGQKVFRTGMLRFEQRSSNAGGAGETTAKSGVDDVVVEGEEHRYSGSIIPDPDAVADGRRDLDDVFAQHFHADDDSQDNDVALITRIKVDTTIDQSPQVIAPNTATQAVTACASDAPLLPSKATLAISNADRPPPSPTKPEKKSKVKLKPLPPDLLIVAGTSLKVPGTKRIVREFAKACRARDRRVYPSDEDDGDGPDEGLGRRSARSCSRKGKSGNSEEEGEDSEEEEDPKAPIRTVLINYDFPIPNKEWEGVFDLWLQGDVQAAARGLAPTAESSIDSGLTITEQFQLSEHFRGEYAPTEEDSWFRYKAQLEEMRKADRRQKSRKSNGNTAENTIKDSVANLSKSPGKGKAGASANAIEIAAGKAKVRETPSSKKGSRSSTAARVPKKSVSPAKKKVKSSASPSPKAKEAVVELSQQKQMAKHRAKATTTANSTKAKSKSKAEGENAKITSMLRAGVASSKKKTSSIAGREGVKSS
ncbi:DHS-like NAD/FAD-binding domain-containing protein [Tilletiaria anomala UBC 951]|uniref:DHS-like NAD/FAD-binding domain-containing protein n=1 Tax=Tilletiaria anomala (strain ATCC 24038 / CBS 436.72 / UBC 951) TaxID=1037660 RepID=A0A066VDW6_TILAU|nr:DHS-like NAD/FAD-binding domain-containing protein [Tilletiaria anomala UBC 951]KDN39912.1 DHS-like NAD/FAD-binding domain-containing protein [Tilletiaria anomala UBC 951]